MFCILNTNNSKCCFRNICNGERRMQRFILHRQRSPPSSSHSLWAVLVSQYLSLRSRFEGPQTYNLECFNSSVIPLFTVFNVIQNSFRRSILWADVKIGFSLLLILQSWAREVGNISHCCGDQNELITVLPLNICRRSSRNSSSCWNFYLQISNGLTPLSTLIGRRCFWQHSLQMPRYYWLAVEVW